MPSLRIIFAGGGTGGHLFPAIAIADEIKTIRPDAEILFIGTRDKIESRIVPQQGFAFRSIWISGFHRSLRISNVLFPVKLIVSLMQVRSIIRSFKPDVVVGTGGYVSGPVLRTAVSMKIPTLIQEQNSYPGITTRLLAQKVNEVHLTFESSRSHFQRMDNIFVTGNPTRDDLDNVNRMEALRYFGFDPRDQKRTLLIFGGSLGAHTINQAIEKSIDEMINSDLRIIWQTGKEDFSSARRLSGIYAPSALWIGEFIDRMDYAYAASDLVVCRAGATTLAELTRLGKPSILVPYPHAAANHQVENARTLADAGAAAIIADEEVSVRLKNVVHSLLSDQSLEQMAQKSKRLGKPHSAKEIAERVLRLAGANSSRVIG